MSKLTKLGARRLLRLATILYRADALHEKRSEPAYNQATYVHGCGTPACALGHWAKANRDRWFFDNFQPFLKKQPDVGGDAAKEFSIDEEESEDLFGVDGCDGAQTAKQAAKYIRSFVARKGVA